MPRGRLERGIGRARRVAPVLAVVLAAPVVRRAALAAGAVVAAAGALGSLASVSLLLSGDMSGVGMDFRLYLGYARAWLDSGQWRERPDEGRWEGRYYTRAVAVVWRGER